MSCQICLFILKYGPMWHKLSITFSAPDQSGKQWNDNSLSVSAAYVYTTCRDVKGKMAGEWRMNIVCAGNYVSLLNTQIEMVEMWFERWKPANRRARQLRQSVQIHRENVLSCVLCWLKNVIPIYLRKWIAAPGASASLRKQFLKKPLWEKVSGTEARKRGWGRYSQSLPTLCSS